MSTCGNTVLYQRYQLSNILMRTGARLFGIYVGYAARLQSALDCLLAAFDMRYVQPLCKSAIAAYEPTFKTLHRLL